MIMTFDFSTALHYLRQRVKIRRDSWASGDYIELASYGIVIRECQFNGDPDQWAPQQDDIMASDWMLVNEC